MIPIPWQVELLGVGLALSFGCFLGISFGSLFSAALRRRPRYVLDAVTGTVGAMIGIWLSATSSRYAIEVNGAVVRWQAAASWPDLRAWAFEHGFLAAIISCGVCVLAGRGLAGAATHRGSGSAGPLHPPGCSR